MSKFFGTIGFVQTKETEPGVWAQSVEERLFSGDITQTTASWNDAQRINGDLEINHTLSVICDNYLTQNMFALRYVNYVGRRWAVRKVEVRPPRMILVLGKEYIMEGDTHDRITSNEDQACCLKT